MSVVSCRLTSAELDQVTDAATTAGCSISAYVRAAALARIHACSGSTIEQISVSPYHRWMISGGDSFPSASRTHLAAGARVVM